MKKYLLLFLLPFALACSKEESRPAVTIDIQTYNFAFTRWELLSKDTGDGFQDVAYKTNEFVHYEFLEKNEGQYIHQHSSTTTDNLDFIYLKKKDTLIIDYGPTLLYYKIEALDNSELTINNFKTVDAASGNTSMTPINRSILRRVN